MELSEVSAGVLRPAVEAAAPPPPPAPDALREQSAAQDRLLASVEYLTDPNLGNNLDLWA